MIEKANLHQLPSFVTADGSAIRELAGPAWTAARAQSLAEATVEAHARGGGAAFVIDWFARAGVDVDRPYREPALAGRHVLP